MASPAPESVQVWDAGTAELLFRRKYACASEWVEAALPAPDGRGLARSVVVSARADLPDDAPQYTAVTVTDHAAGRAAKLDPVPWMLYHGTRFSPRRDPGVDPRAVRRDPPEGHGCRV